MYLYNLTLTGNIFVCKKRSQMLPKNTPWKGHYCFQSNLKNIQANTDPDRNNILCKSAVSNVDFDLSPLKRAFS